MSSYLKPDPKTDPFLSSETCADRLMKEWREHKRLILALDFDDTVFDFHKAGRFYPYVLQAVKEAVDLGFYIMLFTGSDPSTWSDACSYLNQFGIKVDTINHNVFPLPFGNHGKPYANIFLDDRAGLRQALEILGIVIERIKKEKELEATA